MIAIGYYMATCPLGTQSTSIGPLEQWCVTTHVPKTKSCHRATMVITRRAHCFYIKPTTKVVQKYLSLADFKDMRNTCTLKITDQET